MCRKFRLISFIRSKIADHMIPLDKMAPTGGSSSTTDLCNSTLNDSSMSVSGTSTEYKVYKRRWFILCVIGLLNLSNAMVSHLVLSQQAKISHRLAQVMSVLLRGITLH